MKIIGILYALIAAFYLYLIAKDAYNHTMVYINILYFIFYIFLALLFLCDFTPKKKIETTFDFENDLNDK